MRASLVFVVLLGCSDCRGSSAVDGGAVDGGAEDARVELDRCGPADLPPWLCRPVTAAGDPMCGDFRLTPSCDDGRWTCSSSLRPDRDHECGCEWTVPNAICGCDGEGGTVCFIECGAVRCRPGTEYCALAVRPSGETATQTCRPLEPGCGTPSCDCVAEGALSCSENGSAIVARYSLP